MNSVSRPVSEIIKNQDVDEPKKRSREDWRKAKELEEARKAGNAPAAVDEDGKDINPHLPQYISSAPWYFGAKTATLKHQRPQPDKQKEWSKISDDYVRGLKGSVSVKYRAGACENCGAMTHKKKDCLERPRKVGAKYSQSAFAPDEVLPPKLTMDYDGKRDRWNGFDPNTFQTIIEEFSKVEEAKRHLKEEKLKQDYMTGETNQSKEQTGDGDLDDDDDEEKYADHADMPGTKVDSKQRITVRNLRIREDTAKYLRNLDPNSAYYDPKTRAMRDNPYKSTGKTPEELNYAGDNFVRYTGDTSKHSQTQSFAWQAYEKGVEVNLLAEPTKAELLHQEFQVKKEEVKDNIKGSIVEKYGGEEYLQAPPKQLLFAQTEDYVEYSRQGQIVKGIEKPIVRSKYEEDVYVNNHTSVWGSYWSDFRWGYRCCHSFIKNSYCTGAAGKEPFKKSSNPSWNTGFAGDGIHLNNEGRERGGCILNSYAFILLLSLCFRILLLQSLILRNFLFCPWKHNLPIFQNLLCQCHLCFPLIPTRLPRLSFQLQLIRQCLLILPINFFYSAKYCFSMFAFTIVLLSSFSTSATFCAATY